MNPAPVSQAQVATLRQSYVARLEQDFILRKGNERQSFRMRGRGETIVEHSE